MCPYITYDCLYVCVCMYMHISHTSPSCELHESENPVFPLHLQMSPDAGSDKHSPDGEQCAHPVISGTHGAQVFEAQGWKNPSSGSTNCALTDASTSKSLPGPCEEGTLILPILFQDMKAKRGKVVWPRLHSLKKVEEDFEPRKSGVVIRMRMALMGTSI